MTTVAATIHTYLQVIMPLSYDLPVDILRDKDICVVRHMTCLIINIVKLQRQNPNKSYPKCSSFSVQYTTRMYQMPQRIVDAPDTYML